jgi:nitroreductase/NAD-dependent dihydropyrimidine dehydrogenase PreA subunit
MATRREVIKWTWDDPLLGKTEPPTWDDLQSIFRPEEHIHWGTVQFDREKCNQCGLCVKNCLAGTLEMDEDNYPRVREDWDGMPGHPEHPWPCFACWQCLVPCPTEAISIANETWYDGGFWKTLPYRAPNKLPQQPRDAEGKPAEWTTVEREVMIRRSVREYTDKPVPEYIIRRVLEAGRFAPTAGNYQGARFIVLTDKAFMEELETTAVAMYDQTWAMYSGEESVRQMALGQYKANPQQARWGWGQAPPVTRGGIGTAIRLRLRNIWLGAPAVIILASDMRCIGQPQMQIGIAGQNMNLVAHSLGVKACWVGFPAVLNARPDIMSRLGLEPPFQMITTMTLGYPKFKQEGVVPRQFWPITWFREGAGGPEVETEPVWPEVEKPGATSALKQK